MNIVTITELRKNGTIWLIVLYLLLSVMVAAFSVYQLKQQELNVLSRGLTNVKPFTFTINDHHKTIDWRELATNQQFTILIEIDVPHYGFFYHKETYVPPMVSGRFFQKNDFYNNKKRVVVGKAVDKEKIESIQQNGFEIIGTMGASYSSAIDQMVLYNIDSIEQGKPLPSTVYVMNIKNSPFSTDYISFKKGNISVNAIDRGDKGALRFLGVRYYQLAIASFFILLFVCFSLLFSHYWLSKKRIEMNILWTLGIPIKRAYQRYSITFFVILTVCYSFIGFMSCLWLEQHFSNSQAFFMHIRQLLVGYVVILLSASFSIWLSFRKSNQYTLRRRGVW